jgi:holo-[acyl-carrier protein] synthase
VIVGTGIDLVDVARVRALLARHGERALRRFFTEDEAHFCHATADPAQCFAARLAAKEAALKAFATGRARGIRWRDVEVVRNHAGTPSLRFHGAAASRAAELHADHTWLSLSHERGQACAIVLLESSV